LITSVRKKFNELFTEDNYKKFLKDLSLVFSYPIDFRIAETPVFHTGEFKDELISASSEILGYIFSESYLEISKKAIPPDLEVPNDPGYPHMIAMDFAITKNNEGALIPQLIELQGFPTLFCYQELLNVMLKKHFEIPKNYTNFFNGINHDSYIEELRNLICGNEEPENVILLEIEPEKQKTRIDFSATEMWLGVKAVCLTEIYKKGKELYYKSGTNEILIRRIYNRVIFDELYKRKDLKLNFSFKDELNVEWIPHPNWFFRISKYTMPFLKSKYVPETKFLSEINSRGVNLDNYILKPLYSFAGSGVIFNVTQEILDSIKNKSDYILQKKRTYEPLIETPDIPAKAEIRLMFIWKDGKPLLINNLVRLSKGKMMGVDFNRDKTWVGSSIANFPE
jgi:hypothetical protein